MKDWLYGVWEDLKDKVSELLAKYGHKLVTGLVVTVVVLVLLIVLSACVTVIKPMLSAKAPGGEVSIELYSAQCTNTTAMELGLFALSQAPFPIEPALKEAKWIGHKEGKDYAGCWQEIPQIDSIFLVFEDGDVKVLRKEIFMQMRGRRVAPRINVI